MSSSSRAALSLTALQSTALGAILAASFCSFATSALADHHEAGEAKAEAAVEISDSYKKAMRLYLESQGSVAIIGENVAYGAANETLMAIQNSGAQVTEQMQTIVKEISEYVHGNEAFETNPNRVLTFVFLDSFGDSSINIMLYCFTKTTVWGEWLSAKQDLAYAVKEIVERNGAAFAFPSTSLYVESLPFGTPEAFPGTDPDSASLPPEASQPPAS